jgi:hypothetical protein
MDDPPPFNLDDLPDDLRGRIKAELVPGERLLWAAPGRREPGRIIGEVEVMQILLIISLVAISGLCLAIDLGAFGRDDEYHKMLVPVMFIVGLVAVLFMIVVGASISQKWTTRRETPSTLYALTDRRAIVWVSNPKTKGVAIHSFRQGRLGGVHRLEYPDGSGDLTFHYIRDSYYGPEEFVGIPDVRRVEDLVRQILVNPNASVDQIDDDDDSDFM